ncbi:MAG: response regulator [Pirellulaceae bacterium]
MTLQPERSAEGLRILVVDDNPDAANTLAKLLKALGHGVNVAYRGPAALEESREHHFDLIISDLLMPGMNGRELAAELREEASDRPLTIVALTGLARPQDQGTRQLFDRILLKPVRFDVLESLLSEVATRRGTGGPLRD